MYLVFIPFLEEGCGNNKGSSKEGHTNDPGPGKQALLM